MSYSVQSADSFDVLRRLSDGVFDHVITDPPYDAHCQANQMSGTTLEKVDLGFAPLAAVGGYDFTRDLVRVSKRWALSFCTLEGFGAIQQTVGPAYVRGCVWYKPNSMGQLTGDRPGVAFEGIAALHRTDVRKRWNGRGSWAIWACNGTRGEKGRHKNQKPLKLLLELVAKFTDRGETVFDPFAGSGRIGEACLLLGRHYVGLERDHEWVEKAKARLADADARFGSITDAEVIGSTRMPKTIVPEEGEEDQAA